MYGQEYGFSPAFGLYSGSLLMIGTPQIFPFHFTHFLVRGDVHNPDIGIVDINRLRPFSVFLYTFMDYDFIHKGVKDFGRKFVNTGIFLRDAYQLRYIGRFRVGFANLCGQRFDFTL